MAWSDGTWWSEDGVRLHYRDHPGGGEGRPAILCLPGLTRNARDFEDVAGRLAPGWRVICPDLRGRGESGYDRNAMNYAPLVYMRDIERLILDLALERFVLFGTSLGGMLTMLLSAAHPGRVAGALLNDIGPTIEAHGLQRIRTYVGKGGSWPTWLHAARALADTHAAAFPDYGIEDWLVMAKRLCRLTPAGRVVPDYDQRIAEPMRAAGGEAGFDMWPMLESMREMPALLVRGALSDILSTATADEMRRRLPRLEEVVIPRTGHAPTLGEPQARGAIDRLLGRIEVPR